MKEIKENKLVKELSDELCRCLECGKLFYQETDIELCNKCVDKFNLDKLWEMHDNNKIDALNFNENKKIREKFRIKCKNWKKLILKIKKSITNQS